jgi:hypothetical protein
MRGIAMVLALAGALSMLGIATPAAAQAGRLASTPYACDPSGGPYPGYSSPYAYAAYYYGYPRNCGGTIIDFFLFGPAFYGHQQGGPRNSHQRGWYRH